MQTNYSHPLLVRDFSPNVRRHHHLTNAGDPPHNKQSQHQTVMLQGIHRQSRKPGMSDSYTRWRSMTLEDVHKRQAAKNLTKEVHFNACRQFLNIFYSFHLTKSTVTHRYVFVLRHKMALLPETCGH